MVDYNGNLSQLFYLLKIYKVNHGFGIKVSPGRDNLAPNRSNEDSRVSSA